MWALLLIPAAALGGYLYSQRNPSPSASKDAKPLPGTGTVDGHGTGVLTGPVAGVPAPPTGPAVPGLGLGLPGTGNVDGHGTGSIDLAPNALDAAAAAQKVMNEIAAKQAAALAAQQIAQQQGPGGDVAAAAQAAEAIRIQIINALNTPEGDRTPEQLALLSSVAGLPVLG